MVAAEGSFVRSGDPPAFRFAVGLGSADSAMCEELRESFGCGSVHRSPRRRAHYDDEVVFVIAALKDHVGATIPFMDAHLPASYKRTQYLTWRTELLDYWEHRARRPRPCTIDGCDHPRKAWGLCRCHLWELRRQ
jgi:hypothetical protein